MSSQIQFAKEVLDEFLERKRSGVLPSIDRAHVVAHATLSGWVDHWPSRAEAGLRDLLSETQEIKTVERSRWVVQRRIAIAKLSRELSSS